MKQRRAGSCKQRCGKIRGKLFRWRLFYFLFTFRHVPFLYTEKWEVSLPLFCRKVQGEAEEILSSVSPSTFRPKISSVSPSTFRQKSGIKWVLAEKWKVKQRRKISSVSPSTFRQRRSWKQWRGRVCR